MHVLQTTMELQHGALEEQQILLATIMFSFQASFLEYSIVSKLSYQPFRTLTCFTWKKTTNLKTIPLLYWGCQKTSIYLGFFWPIGCCGLQKIWGAFLPSRVAKAKGISWKVTEPIRQGRIGRWSFCRICFHRKVGHVLKWERWEGGDERKQRIRIEHMWNMFKTIYVIHVFFLDDSGVFAVFVMINLHIVILVMWIHMYGFINSSSEKIGACKWWLWRLVMNLSHNQNLGSMHPCHGECVEERTVCESNEYNYYQSSTFVQLNIYSNSQYDYK